MKIRLLIHISVLPLFACGTLGTPPRNDAGMADAQAKLSTSPSQADLWRDAIKTGSVTGIEAALIKGAAVQRREPVRIAERPAEIARVPFPETMETGVAVLAAPVLEQEFFTSVGRLTSAEGEFLTFDLGEGRILQLQAKVGGVPLRARTGDTAQIVLRRSDPFQRNDVVSVKLPEDELVYTLVGSNEPVRVSVAAHALAARQTGTPRRNSMAVAVTVGRETKTLEAGDQADFRAGGLTVKILASVAVQGEAANVLPGQPYRLELVAWRTLAR